MEGRYVLNYVENRETGRDKRKLVTDVLLV